MGKIKLSIIVIGYNVEKYIERCINSIKSQLNSKVELIFVDDGSKDCTKKKIKIQEVKNLKYLYKENGGANSARIFGFKHSKGEYISFVDADDTLEENYIDTILKNIENAEPDILTFNYFLEKYDGSKNINENYEVNEYNNYQFLESILSSKIPHYLWNKIYKKEFLTKCDFGNIPKITIGDDLIANIRFGIEKPKVKAIENVLYNYFINVNSFSRKSSSKILEMTVVLSELEKLLKSNQIDKKYTKEIEFQYFRTYYYYCVRNKTGTYEISKKIYKTYKSKRIKIRQNLIIRQWINDKKKLEKVLIYLYLISYNLGFITSRIYVIYDKYKEKKNEKN